MPQLTPTEQKLLNHMSDGLGHTTQSLILFLDEYLSPQGLRAHIFRIRQKLKTHGEDIEGVFTNRGYVYRYVRKMASAVDGKS